MNISRILAMVYFLLCALSSLNFLWHIIELVLDDPLLCENVFLLCVLKSEPTFSNPNRVSKISEALKERFYQIYHPVNFHDKSRESYQGFLSRIPH